MHIYVLINCHIATKALCCFPGLVMLVLFFVLVRINNRSDKELEQHIEHRRRRFQRCERLRAIDLSGLSGQPGPGDHSDHGQDVNDDDESYGVRGGDGDDGEVDRTRGGGGWGHANRYYDAEHADEDDDNLYRDHCSTHADTNYDYACDDGGETEYDGKSRNPTGDIRGPNGGPGAGNRDSSDRPNVKTYVNRPQSGTERHDCKNGSSRCADSNMLRVVHEGLGRSGERIITYDSFEDLPRG